MSETWAQVKDAFVAKFLQLANRVVDHDFSFFVIPNDQRHADITHEVVESFSAVKPFWRVKAKVVEQEFIEKQFKWLKKFRPIYYQFEDEDLDRWVNKWIFESLVKRFYIEW